MDMFKFMLATCAAACAGICALVAVLNLISMWINYRREKKPAPLVEKVPIVYSCESCANKGTPLCNSCFHVEHTDGTWRRPTYYTRLYNIPLTDLIESSEPRIKTVKLAIMRYANEGKPIPTALVFEYNALSEKEE